MELERPFFRLGNPTLWGVGATVFIIVVAMCLSQQQTCASEVGGFKICQTKLAYLITAPPNEVGDALAGVAGVLAFIWIIVTVALQSEELRAQREVLRLTRDEMEEQRKATQDMARSMAAQAAIFEDEKRHRTESEASALLESLLVELAEFLNNHPKIVWVVKEPSLSAHNFLTPKDEFFSPELEEVGLELLYSGDRNIKAPKDQISMHFRTIDETRTKLKLHLHNKTIASFPISPLRSYGIEQRLQDLCDLSEKLSSADKVRLRMIGVENALISYRQICDLPIWKIPESGHGGAK